MKMVADGVRLSATDVANHVACRHLTTLDLAVAQERLRPPEITAWLPASMQQRGQTHENAYVAFLRTRHDRILDLRDCRLTGQGFRQTRKAMAGGADVILQAPLGNERWAGRADILQRVDRPSELGAWSYEPLDTKLARETRDAAILQLCAYADMLLALQGVRPEWVHVVAPGKPFSDQSHRVADFFAYYSLVRRRLLAFIDEDVSTYPEPTPHCEICRWMYECNRRRRQDDHLSLVANVRSSQIAEFAGWQIATLATLGAAAPPFPSKPRRASIESLERVQAQARVQLEARVQGDLIHEALPLVPGQGLFRLPAPSAGDVFFDIEGDPFVGELGLEYLFGYAYQDVGERSASRSGERSASRSGERSASRSGERSASLSGERADGDWHYIGDWALDPAEENRAFQNFVAFLIERWAAYPDFHVYHYAAYEASAIRRLTSIRTDWESKGFPVARPPAKPADPAEDLAEQEIAVRVLMRRLLEDVPADSELRTPDQRAGWLLAQLLEFHRREDTAVWWEFFRLADLPADEVLDEPVGSGWRRVRRTGRRPAHTGVSAGKRNHAERDQAAESLQCDPCRGRGQS